MRFRVILYPGTRYTSSCTVNRCIIKRGITRYAHSVRQKFSFFPSVTSARFTNKFDNFQSSELANGFHFYKCTVFGKTSDPIDKYTIKIRDVVTANRYKTTACRRFMFRHLRGESSVGNVIQFATVFATTRIFVSKRFFFPNNAMIKNIIIIIILLSDPFD